MSFLKQAFTLLTRRYVEEERIMSAMIENEKKHGYLRDLIETGDRIIEENPNFVDEVQKSETGCWMDQMYGKHHCAICDFIDDCPIKLEADWQEYLAQQTPEHRAALIAQVEAAEAKRRGEST